MGGACSTGFWWGNSEGRKPLGRPKRRWEDNIKMDLQDVGYVRVWIGLSWLRIETLVNAVMNLRVP
jgi:hypothetical protein